MKIAIVTEHNCIRTMKQVMVLRNIGHEVILVTKRRDLRDYPIYNYWMMYDDIEGLRSIVRDLDKTVDVWYIANEPSYTIGIVRQVCPNAKIVVDVHDMNYWRMTPDKCGNESGKESYVFEDMMLNFADGFVVPSMACKDYLDRFTEKLVAYVPSARPRQMFNHFGCTSCNGLVSMGGHSAPYQPDLLAWRDYTKIYDYFQGKINITALCPDWNEGHQREVKKHYEKFKIQLEQLPDNLMIQRMGEFCWSLIGNWSDKLMMVWKYALPNKFWDSVAAGVPVVVINCPSVSAIVEKYDIGITIQHPQELIENWHKHVIKRTNLLLKREKLCMENYINLLVDILETVSGKNEMSL